MLWAWAAPINVNQMVSLGDLVVYTRAAVHLPHHFIIWSCAIHVDQMVSLGDLVVYPPAAIHHFMFGSCSIAVGMGGLHSFRPFGLIGGSGRLHACGSSSLHYLELLYCYEHGRPPFM